MLVARRPARSSQPRSRASALGDVEIGREVAALGDDDATRRARRAAAARRAALSTLNRLTEVESPTITSSGAAPTSARDLVADALRRGRSSRRCSSCGSGPCPIRRSTTCGDARGRRLRQRAERIAVEVDHACRAGRTARAAARAGRPHRRGAGTRRGASSPAPAGRRAPARHRPRSASAAGRSARSRPSATSSSTRFSSTRRSQRAAACGGCRATCCRPDRPTGCRCRRGARRGRRATSIVCGRERR